jgi:hypothetical protein
MRNGEPRHNEDITRRIINRQEPPTQKWGPGLHASRDWTQPQTRLHAGPTRNPPHRAVVFAVNAHIQPLTASSSHQFPDGRPGARNGRPVASKPLLGLAFHLFFFLLPFFFLVAVYSLLAECDQAHLQPTSWKKPSTQPAVSTKSTRAAT